MELFGRGQVTDPPRRAVPGGEQMPEQGVLVAQLAQQLRRVGGERERGRLVPPHEPSDCRVDLIGATTMQGTRARTPPRVSDRKLIAALCLADVLDDVQHLFQLAIG